MMTVRPLRLIASLTLVLAPAATHAAGPPATQATDIARFFTGRTEGLGRLKVVMRGAVTVRVQSSGRTERDGTLVLTQVIHEGDKPARTRGWRIRETSPGRYAATLSDARGPVTLERAGGRLRIAYTGVDGNAYQQWLTFAADGRSARNTMEVRKFGMKVATLDETIRKLD
ncbi:MAG: DUF3833 family protein [Novosphingobium sp.]